MRDGRYIPDDRYAKPRALKSTQGAFSAGARPLNEHGNCAHSVFLSSASSFFSSQLRGKWRAFARTLEATRTCTGPRNRVPVYVRDRDDGIVESRLDMGDSGRNVLSYDLFRNALLGGCHLK